MELEPITRQEKIIAGQDLTPITRMEMFLKQFGGGGGGGSVPKPLTYDYMPEGYPKKTMGTVTVMEEQELAFATDGGPYVANLTNALEIVEGQTYTVNWDGTDYECECFAVQSFPSIGNSSILGGADDAGEPFLYLYNPNKAAGQFITLETSAIHTISVKTTGEIVTPMAEEFLPNIPADKLPDADALYLKSSTADSTKKLKITVDASGTISATEVT